MRGVRSLLARRLRREEKEARAPELSLGYPACGLDVMLEACLGGGGWCWFGSG